MTYNSKNILKKEFLTQLFSKMMKTLKFTIKKM